MPAVYEGPTAKRRYDPASRLSLSEAIDQGEIVYWTGQACPQGHLAHRYVKNQQCVECNYRWGKLKNRQKIEQEAIDAGINPELRREIERRLEQRELGHLFDYDLDV